MPGGRGAKSQHGGYRAPASPAPVSGPGALAQRTDGGPGSAKQPIRPIPSSGPGSTIGDRQASVQLQQGAPLAAGTPMPPPAALPQGAGPVAAPVDPFGPTNRPNEPVTAGANLGAGPPAASETTTAADFLRGVLAAHPEAAQAITALLEQLDR